MKGGESYLESIEFDAAVVFLIVVVLPLTLVLMRGARGACLPKVRANFCNMGRSIHHLSRKGAKLTACSIAFKNNISHDFGVQACALLLLLGSLAYVGLFEGYRLQNRKAVHESARARPRFMNAPPEGLPFF